MHAEEDNDHADGDASVECGRKDVVVPHPPSEVEPADAIVEDESDNGPRRVINPTTGRDSTNTSEEHGHVNVAPEGQGEAASKEVEGHGGKGSDSEEPQ